MSLQAVRARVERLAAERKLRGEAPMTTAELLVGHQLDEPERSMTLEEIVAGSRATAAAS